MKLVPIVDFAFNVDFAKDLSERTREQINSSGVQLNNFFIKSHNGSVYNGRVWPGTSVFPDFYHPHIGLFWEPYLESLHSQIPFDGVWLDMNEIANF